ncbi:helix-turn-helix domain-containing protein [Pseudoalteromonas piscicida]|uniref:AraC family transcriptional regulator n=1 Tax=Pseudoalteromonas piscicida TaxID=43662 RepID=A0A2A5JRZ7_PSEO7|nr:helix-turn-helix domain-containing protein [Pseudoalteromonas piscicida]PCK32157.1 AraC family transcriptional regulator [Pseudoalteromonas piscicida]
MTADLNLQIHHPDGMIAQYVQAIWFAQSRTQGAAWLPSDGANGFIFPIKGKVYLGDDQVALPYLTQPTATHSVKIHYSAQACFCGLRFQPAGLGVLKASAHPLVEHKHINKVVKALKNNPSFKTLLELLKPMLAAEVTLDRSALYTQTLLGHIAKLAPLQFAYTKTPLGQRQLERQIKQYCGITPKHLARIHRARSVRKILKDNPNINFAQLAIECGYADQAHLIREFKSIMQITPAKYRKRIQAMSE